MNETIIGLLSAIGVVAIQKIADFISDRWNHKEQKEDRKESTNNKVLSEIKKLREDVQNVREDVEALKRTVSDNEMVNSRIRILRFEDEMQHGYRHSRGHFEQIKDDIDIYRKFCEEHKDFHNGIGHDAMEHVEEVYKKCLREHDFTGKKEGAYVQK